MIVNCPLLIFIYWIDNRIRYRAICAWVQENDGSVLVVGFPGNETEWNSRNDIIFCNLQANKNHNKKHPPSTDVLKNQDVSGEKMASFVWMFVKIPLNLTAISIKLSFFKHVAENHRISGHICSWADKAERKKCQNIFIVIKCDPLKKMFILFMLTVKLIINFEHNGHFELTVVSCCLHFEKIVRHF